ncbi:hypothetical protein FBU59_006448, partial [Linderina macrospora]
PTAKPAGAYRPPHARNRPAGDDSPRSLSDMAERKVFGNIVNANRVVPGAPAKVPVGASPEQASKSKNRRRNRGKKNGEEKPEAKPEAKPEPPKPEEPMTEIDILKKVRNIKKKIGQIEALEVRKNDGETLEANQLAKIASKASLETEIEQLNQKLAKLSPA